MLLRFEVQVDPRQGGNRRWDFSPVCVQSFNAVLCLPVDLLPAVAPFVSVMLGDFSRSRWSQLDNILNTQSKKNPQTWNI